MNHALLSDVVYENSIHLDTGARVENKVPGNPDQGASRTLRKAERPFGVCVGVDRQFLSALKLAIEKAIKGVQG